jgi:alpha-1,6-mannosyltransferase
MKIVDVCAFYAPRGGGVKTYIRQKLVAGPKLGHEIVILAPGEANHVEHIGPAARLVTIAAPKLPMDRRYFYFDDAEVVHRFLDQERPDFVEASSPWRSASIVANWQSSVPRSLIMHADPLSAYAYRWLGQLFSRPAIDRQFDWFWKHLQRLDRQYDVIISASDNLSSRLKAGGLRKVETNLMGIESGIFTPKLRDEELRRELLARCSLGPEATLLLGVSRHAPEKRLPMLIDAAVAAGNHTAIGLVFAGEGRETPKIIKKIGSNPHLHLLAPIAARSELATLLASADALLHGSDAETFCMAAAEARASGLPIIAPDLGAASDHCIRGAGELYEAGNSAAAARAILKTISNLQEQRTKASVRASNVGTMDDHFSRLFYIYERQAMRRAA